MVKFTLLAKNLGIDKSHLWREYGSNKHMRLQAQALGALESNAKKNTKIFRSGDNVMLPVTDLDRAKIDSQ